MIRLEFLLFLEDSHAPTVHFIGEGFEVVGSAKFIIELRNIGNPVSVVGITIGCSRADVVLAYGTDPDYKGG